MVGLVHLTRPNATKILVGADGRGREAQTNVASPSFVSKDDLFKLFIKLSITMVTKQRFPVVSLRLTKATKTI